MGTPETKRELMNPLPQQRPFTTNPATPSRGDCHTLTRGSGALLTIKQLLYLDHSCFVLTGKVPSNWVGRGESGVAHSHSRSPAANEGHGPGTDEAPDPNTGLDAAAIGRQPASPALGGC